jgi:two-component system cell cycle sensor histidine kinase/response regulator CckA
MAVAKDDSISVLIVDDDDALLRTLSDVLELHGIHTVTAGSAHRALALASELASPPAVALVDLRLPDMDGLELVARLHEVSSLTQVVVLTGHASLSTALQALREESFDYLVKPVPPDQLIRTIRSATDRWRRESLEEEFRRANERFRLLLENLSEVILVVDADGGVRYASPSLQRVTGQLPESVEGRSLLDLVDPAQQEAAREYLRGIVTGTPGDGIRLRVRDESGHWRLLELLGRNLLDHPVVSGIVLTARDVTERDALEMQLRRAQKMETIGRLAGGIAHDFNNLLAAIMGSVELALGRSPHADVAKDLELIQETARRAAELTRRLLTFSRQKAIEPEIVDLRTIVSSVERMLERILGDTVTLTTRLHDGGAQVLVDPGQMERVLLNLALNARDAMPSGGTLTIETEQVEIHAGASRPLPDVSDGAFVALRVRDTGMGMSEELQARIFEPYFTTKEPGKGTGLGLSTAYGIVRQMEGHIWVESRPGAGSTFHLLLPTSAAASDTGAHRVPARLAPQGHETILLVEDDHAVRRTTASLLRMLGYTVLEALTREQAVDAARQTAALGLLISDVVMPETDGMELAAAVRLARPSCRVLYISGYTETALLGRRSLDAPLLAKPYTVDQLAHAVRATLASAPS